jgi:hypothetical protein
MLASITVAVSLPTPGISASNWDMSLDKWASAISFFGRSTEMSISRVCCASILTTTFAALGSPIVFSFIEQVVDPTNALCRDDAKVCQVA